MRGHGGVEGGAARCKTFTLCIVVACNVAHKLGHAVAVVVWWFEGVFGNQPAGREDNEVESCSAE
jgi:hypothetical protein